MDDYRRSLTPFPFVEGKNSEFRYTSSKWMARFLDGLFWLISALSLVLAIAVFPTNLAWSITLLICSILVCPLVPVHFVAKLFLCGFAVLPPSVAFPISALTGILWLVSVLRGPANDNDA